MPINEYADVVAAASRQASEPPTEAVNRMWPMLGIEDGEVQELAKRALASLVSQRLTKVSSFTVASAATAKARDGALMPKETRFLASLVYVTPHKSKPMLDFTVEDWNSYRTRCVAAVEGFGRRVKLADAAIRLLTESAAETTGELPLESLRELGALNPDAKLLA